MSSVQFKKTIKNACPSLVYNRVRKDIVSRVLRLPINTKYLTKPLAGMRILLKSHPLVKEFFKLVYLTMTVITYV